MGSHNKAATEVAAHSVKDTGVHGVGASTVCSETEADGKITTHAGVSDAHHTPPSTRTVATGSYTGNETARQITTGFKCSLVIVHTSSGTTGDESSVLIPNITIGHTEATSKHETRTAQISLHASDGFSLSNSPVANDNGVTYYYWAISE